jgi:hypothetical protein
MRKSREKIKTRNTAVSTGINKAQFEPRLKLNKKGPPVIPAGPYINPLKKEN